MVYSMIQYTKNVSNFEMAVTKYHKREHSTYFKTLNRVYKYPCSHKSDIEILCKHVEVYYCTADQQ